MPRKVLCYHVRAELVDEDDDGNIVGTVATQPVRLFGRQQVIEHLDSIDELTAAGGEEATG